MSIAVAIENTNACGADCIMCPRDKFSKKIQDMPNDLFYKSVKEAYEIGIRRLDICGYGDPLIDKQFAERVKWIKLNYLDMELTTTSTCQLLSGKVADAVAEYIDYLKISNYGFRKKTFEAVHRGSLVFEDVKNNIEKFLERTSKPHVTIAFTIFEENRNEIEAWKNYWIEKVDDMQIWYPHNWGGGMEDAQCNNPIFLKNDIKTCGRPGRDILIRVDGDVCACCLDFNHDLVIGNLYEESLDSILEGERIKKIIEVHQCNKFEESNLICSKCSLIYDRKNALYYCKDENFEVGQRSMSKNML